MPDSLIDLVGLQVGAEDFLVAVLETTAQPIWVVDPDGLIRFANPAAIAALGYDSADELFGRHSHETIHHSRPDGTPYPAADCPMLLPRVTGETVTRELDWFFRRDGSMFPVSYVSAPLDMRDGRGAVVAFSDIEDRMRAERQLRYRDEALAAQQATLRRVAALVAGGAASAEVFAAVAREVASLLDLHAVAVSRYEPDGTVTVLGAWSDRPQPFETGTRWPLDGQTIAARVKQTGGPARVDYAELPGAIAEAAHAHGIRSGAGAPIVVDGRVWGVMATWVRDHEPLPGSIEDRLAELTALIAAAFSNTASRDEVARLADEQAALRRVATLVARQSSPAEVLGAVTDEVARLFGTAVGLLRFEPDGTASLVAQSRTPWDPPPLGTRFSLEGEHVVSAVLRTGRASRLDDWTHASGAVAAMAQSLGIRSTVGSPIVVEGRLWGTMITASNESEPQPADTESRLGQFTELVATAIANAEARGELSRLADEQAALRRVATLVARGAPPAEVFDAVAAEVGQLLGVASTGLIRFDPDNTATLVAGWGVLTDRVPIGTRLPLGGLNVSSEVLRTGRPARYDASDRATGALGDHARQLGVKAAAAGPIVVAGHLWGVMSVAAVEGGPLPAGAESRLAEFSELAATAIANAEARGELSRLAEEQAALRRVATLVAEESPPAQLFAKVAEEVASLLGSNIDSAILRYEGDEAATVVAVWGEQPPGGIRVGARLPVDGSSVTAQVLRERRSVRVDDYLAVDGAIADHAQEHGIRSAIGCPILVQGRLWGAMVVAHYEAEPFPPDTERRVAQFTELMATAIANTEARTERQRLADEQAALRRVATLVAEGAAPTEVFDAVVVEVAQLLGAAQVGLMRFEGSDEITILAHRGQDPALVQAGMRLPLDGDSVTARVRRSGRSARLNLYEERSGTIAAIAQGSRVNMTVGAPIVVEGALWGAMTASWTGEDLPPPDAEERLAEFAELVDTAIANADGRDQLMASRARVLTAGDEARRRVVRDLHDGAQQRLVHTIVTLKLARRALSDDGQQAEALLSEALAQAEQGNAELRELVHGILPSVLTRGGLRAAVESLVARLHLLVDVDVTSRRLASEVEASAYFIVAEALTNVVKHAQATCAEVTAAVDNGTLHVVVRDDGTGGADPQGHGLQGIGDRVAALGGRLRIDSSRGAGTRLTAELPLADGPPGEALRSAPSNAERRPA